MQRWWTLSAVSRRTVKAAEARWRSERAAHMQSANCMNLHGRMRIFIALFDAARWTSFVTQGLSELAQDGHTR